MLDLRWLHYSYTVDIFCIAFMHICYDAWLSEVSVPDGLWWYRSANNHWQLVHC